MILLVVGNAAVLAVAIGVVIHLRRRVRALERDARSAAGDSRRAEVIAVEITNHRDVAVARTALAKPLASLTPGLLRSLVHQEACSIMRRELAANGVAADVRVRRIRVPVVDETDGADRGMDSGDGVRVADARDRVAGDRVAGDDLDDERDDREHDRDEHASPARRPNRKRSRRRRRPS